MLHSIIIVELNCEGEENEFKNFTWRFFCKCSCCFFNASAATSTTALQDPIVLQNPPRFIVGEESPLIEQEILSPPQIFE